ncbi:MAG: hypothetical protein HY033_07355, partial [Ignavibacteriae bacterium]|nr:hypothetical protein [Ignavibacteriota bacterium]
MNRYRTVLLVLVLSHLITPSAFSEEEHAQDLNGIIQRLRDRKEKVSDVEARGGKCGLQNFTDVLDAWNNFTEKQRSQVQELLSPLVSQKERIIGHFDISYDTTGGDEPALLDQNHQRIPGTSEQFIDSVGRFFNDVWNFEIGVLGYAAPPLAADSTFHVTVRDLGTGLYGQTIPDPAPISSGNPARYMTHIEIDNDFQFVYGPSRGMPALKVTAAHEFHHAIQLGSYGYWGDENIYFYEITSTWMEDVVYNDVNDYLQYLSNDPYRSSQFSRPEIRFTKLDGNIEYSRAVWGKFLEKRYSREIMRRIWEFIRQSTILTALDNALSETGSSFRGAFHEFAYWNLNTGPTSDTSRFYSEGHDYPTMNIAAQIEYMPPERSYQDNMQAISSKYYRVCVLTSPSDSCRVEKQMPVIITNFNVGLLYSDAALPFTYKMSSSEIGGSKHLANGLFTKVEVSDPENWDANETVPSVVSEVLAFPNPYRVHDRVPIWFRLPIKPQSTIATLCVFTSSFDRIFSGDLKIIDFN